MRILFVTNMWPTIHKPNYGIFVKKTLSHFQKFRYKCSVIKSPISKVNLGTINYLVLYLKSFIYSTLSFADIIYIHYSSHSSLGVILAKPFTRKKVVVHVHGTDIFGKASHGGLYYSINKKIFAISSLVIAPSIFFKDILIQQYKCPSSKIFISPSGGVDRELFYPNPQVKVKNKITFGFASNLIEGKGGFLLLEVIHSIINEGYDNFSLKIVGKGPEKEKLENYTVCNNLNKFVEFMPTLSHPELGNFFRTLDFFIFPTLLPESLGLVGLEAMACGVPVIGSKIGGIPGYLTHRHNGFLFEPGNHHELKSLIILSILMKKDQYKLMQAEAIKTASNYDSVNIIDNLAKEFKKVIQENN